jgi:hypothetical protein
MLLSLSDNDVSVYATPQWKIEREKKHDQRSSIPWWVRVHNMFDVFTAALESDLPSTLVEALAEVIIAGILFLIVYGLSQMMDTIGTATMSVMVALIGLAVAVAYRTDARKITRKGAKISHALRHSTRVLLSRKKMKMTIHPTNSHMKYAHDSFSDNHNADGFEQSDDDDEDDDDDDDDDDDEEEKDDGDQFDVRFNSAKFRRAGSVSTKDQSLNSRTRNSQIAIMSSGSEDMVPSFDVGGEFSAAYDFTPQSQRPSSAGKRSSNAALSSKQDIDGTAMHMKPSEDGRNSDDDMSLQGAFKSAAKKYETSANADNMKTLADRALEYLTDLEAIADIKPTESHRQRMRMRHRQHITPKLLSRPNSVQGIGLTPHPLSSNPQWSNARPLSGKLKSLKVIRKPMRYKKREERKKTRLQEAMEQGPGCQSALSKLSHEMTGASLVSPNDSISSARM